mmetsp:Transcript_49633/g.105474  ORF Transcript_49633/g.105474 Transcript_49633/m.105474 type:complete len:283 (-) Transcript_49633:1116-1964(-)
MTESKKIYRVNGRSRIHSAVGLLRLLSEAVHEPFPLLSRGREPVDQQQRRRARPLLSGVVVLPGGERQVPHQVLILPPPVVDGPALTRIAVLLLVVFVFRVRPLAPRDARLARLLERQRPFREEAEPLPPLDDVRQGALAASAPEFLGGRESTPVPRPVRRHSRADRPEAQRGGEGPRRPLPQRQDVVRGGGAGLHEPRHGGSVHAARSVLRHLRGREVFVGEFVVPDSAVLFQRIHRTPFRTPLLGHHVLVRLVGGAVPLPRRTCFQNSARRGRFRHVEEL